MNYSIGFKKKSTFITTAYLCNNLSCNYECVVGICVAGVVVDNIVVEKITKIAKSTKCKAMRQQQWHELFV